MKIAIFGNEYQHDTLKHLGELLCQLHDSQVELLIESNFEAYLSNNMPSLPKHAAFHSGEELTDVAVALSIGGDGTFLHTAQSVSKQGIPIMGINSGHLGYLTTADIKDTELVVNQLCAGNYAIEERAMLELVLPDSIPCQNPYALNEVTILRQDTSSTIKIDVSLDDTPLTNFHGDGMIVCTPTGSTAYNLSVGGPILEPHSRCFVMSPISPHTLTMRPMVISDSRVMRVTAVTRAPQFQVSVDGSAIDIPSGTTVEIRKAPFNAQVVMLKGHNFATILRTKLMWGRDARD